jgi:hypothetical protein
VSGLTGCAFEEKVEELGLTTLDERRHQAYMLLVLRIITEKDNVDSEYRFKMGAGAPVRRRQAAGLVKQG